MSSKKSKIMQKFVRIQAKIEILEYECKILYLWSYLFIYLFNSLFLYFHIPLLLYFSLSLSFILFYFPFLSFLTASSPYTVPADDTPSSCSTHGCPRLRWQRVSASGAQCVRCAQLRAGERGRSPGAGTEKSRASGEQRLGHTRGAHARWTEGWREGGKEKENYYYYYLSYNFYY